MSGSYALFFIPFGAKEQTLHSLSENSRVGGKERRGGRKRTEEEEGEARGSGVEGGGEGCMLPEIR